MNRELKNIKNLQKIIARSLFRINPPLSKGRILIAIGKLADMVADSGEGENIWYLSDDYPTADILIGAYWFCSHYHGGQRSPEYLILSKIGRVYSPAKLARGPKPDSVESDTYQNLENF